jgi:osmotically-inducible protein OsmY
MSIQKHLTAFMFASMLGAPLLMYSTGAHSENAIAYTDDAVITTQVKAALLNTAGLKSTEITVETYKGVVKLSGFIDSRSEIEKAVATARHVKGVKSVEDDLSVKCH